MPDESLWQDSFITAPPGPSRAGVRGRGREIGGSRASATIERR